MPTINRRATSKASLIRALRANNVNFSSVKTIKRAGITTTGLYRVTYKYKR